MAAPISPPPAAPPPAAPPRPRRLLLILTWGALAVALLISGAATWLLLFNGPRAEAVARGPAHVFRAGTLVVNVSGSEGRRYLRVTVELGAGSPKDFKRLDEQRAAILDAAIGVLGATSLETLLDHDQRDPLKTALRTKLNQTLGGQPVTQVFFTEFVIQ
ncbi:MAG: flagellar basal body-associated FliL family protein [Candidatus Rokubacteria bacterium]|nr:flagellar basal body-associated FliL family protein [Candidatus Rokubacteria bacterium]MBI4593699.1 flagellar basal body-associated FliL family protein [Candidatus Rokubacteria bacterium]